LISTINQVFQSVKEKLIDSFPFKISFVDSFGFQIYEELCIKFACASKKEIYSLFYQ